jgi:hypothetical protein
VSTISVNGINILEFDRHLNAAIDVVRTCIAQNYNENEEFCDSFSSTFNPVAPSILYMCNVQCDAENTKHFCTYFFSCASPM